MKELDDFNFLYQLFVPGVSGAVGGLILVIIMSMENEYQGTRIRWIKSKFAIIGVIAGIAAVNLLNPSGSFSQVMILSLLAGLSGISYLKRNALVEGFHEDNLLIAKEKSLEKFGVFGNDDNLVPDETLGDQEMEEMDWLINNLYNKRDNK
ncbi:hypothetical protein [Sporosarcina sp. FSL K6-5500]|uniref:hypothetical protein n=1 Tax=Sporosarcina sp. FSL K6-5500 TaxID=2921558 RepID=UPI0030F7026F